MNQPQAHIRENMHKTMHEPNPTLQPQSLQEENYPTSFKPQLTPIQPQTQNQPIHPPITWTNQRPTYRDNMHKTMHEPRPPQAPPSLQEENHPTKFQPQLTPTLEKRTHQQNCLGKVRNNHNSKAT